MATVSIPLSSRKYPGLFILIDEEDYALVSQYRWSPEKGRNTFYANAHIPGTGKHGKHIRLHRLLAQSVCGQLIDHVNGNGLDNRRCNLRPATVRQNSWNTRSYNKAKFKGVHFHESFHKWGSHIKVNGTGMNLGYFTTVEEAARAYDTAARTHFGAFAWLNFPDD